MLQRSFVTKSIDSPVGDICLTASDRGLVSLEFFSSRKINRLGIHEPSEANPILQRAEKQLAEYFAGKRKNFDLRLDLQGTIFQLKAWQELQKIPYGQTISYGEQAKRVGDVKKARAVGMANGRNPVAIIVPCHRVIGANGSLTGFSSGLPIKEFLLKLESSH